MGWRRERTWIATLAAALAGVLLLMGCIPPRPPVKSGLSIAAG